MVYTQLIDQLFQFQKFNSIVIMVKNNKINNLNNNKAKNINKILVKSKNIKKL